MKSIPVFRFLLLTLLSVCLCCLTACTGGNTETDSGTGDSDSTSDTNDTDTPPESNPDDTGKDSSGELETTPVQAVTSRDEAIRFIAANVYSQCADSLPMMLDTGALDLEDSESVAYNTGLTDLTGITDIILSESGVGSIAYSLVYLRTDGTATDTAYQSLTKNINPRKWVCVEAEAIQTLRLDNDILLVMGHPDDVDSVMRAAKQAADGVFENVGDIETVL